VSETPGTQPRSAGRPQDGASTATWFWIWAAAVAVALFYGYQYGYQVLLVVGGWLEVVLDVLLLFVFGLVLSFLVQPAVDMLQRQLRPHRPTDLRGHVAQPRTPQPGARVQDAYARFETRAGLEALGLNEHRALGQRQRNRPSSDPIGCAGFVARFGGREGLSPPASGPG
jgi:hypothetical protein